MNSVGMSLHRVFPKPAGPAALATPPRPPPVLPTTSTPPRRSHRQKRRATAHDPRPHFRRFPLAVR